MLIVTGMRTIRLRMKVYLMWWLVKMKSWIPGQIILLTQTSDISIWCSYFVCDEVRYKSWSFVFRRKIWRILNINVLVMVHIYSCVQNKPSASLSFINRAPLLADLLFYSYYTDFTQYNTLNKIDVFSFYPKKIKWTIFNFSVKNLQWKMCISLFHTFPRITYYMEGGTVYYC